MKICPRCQKTYTDEGLNFCLDDGATLMQSNAGDGSLPATVLLNQPRQTSPNQAFGIQPDIPNSWNQNTNQSQNPNQFSMQPPPKKSNGWLWAVGILGVLVLVCGGGFVGFVFWAASLENKNNSNVAYNVNNSQRTPTPTNKTNVQKIDLSLWVKNDSTYGTTDFSGGEFVMGSKNKGYYYVLASQTNYKTENATTKVSVRNINEDSSTLGFGVVVHSNPVPLTQDYAFVIDSESQKYRVVRHVPGNEITVVGWTRSSSIKDGTQKNVLEVRDENKKMNFYINGDLVKTVDNTDGYSGGVTGLYSGDGVKIGFSDFEISK